MKNNALRLFVLRAVALSLASIGFMQFSHAGMLGTGSLIEQQAGNDGAQRINMLLERQDVAEHLVALGVDPLDVKVRVANLSSTEIATLAQRLDQQIAGGDAVGIIGAVFLVLLILELVGITDVFKGI